jgi:hypothetical protein
MLNKRNNYCDLCGRISKHEAPWYIVPGTFYTVEDNVSYLAISVVDCDNHEAMISWLWINEDGLPEVVCSYAQICATTGMTHGFYISITRGDRIHQP